MSHHADKVSVEGVAYPLRQRASIVAIHRGQADLEQLDPLDYRVGIAEKLIREPRLSDCQRNWGSLSKCPESTFLPAAQFDHHSPEI